MTTNGNGELEQAPWLLSEGRVSALTGYAGHSLAKLVDAGVLALVRPAGCAQGRFRKVQVALLLELESEMWAWAASFRSERLLMPEKAVRAWTGYAGSTLRRIAKAGGLRPVRLPGLAVVRYRRAEVGRLLGLEKFS